MYTGILWGITVEGGHSEDRESAGRINLGVTDSKHGAGVDEFRLVRNAFVGSGMKNL
jgi:hypothetical protein